MKKFQVTLGLLVLAIVAHTGLCIQCYSCNTEEDQNCGEFFQPAHIKTSDCDESSGVHTRSSSDSSTFYTNLTGTGGLNVRIKEEESKPVCFKVTFEGEHAVTARDCGFVGKKDQCKHIDDLAREKKLKVKKCKVCEDSLCNSAQPGHSIAIGLMVPSLLIFTIMK